MSRRPPRTIAIIGAGPAGLAALKSVLETQHYKDGLWNPIVFELRSAVGGVCSVFMPIEDVDAEQE
ncbi:hypothetical protein D9611_007056 [Ephemerocybe angulata]|uniref:Uncharacterized protein n=1 Tax=Ephemerocybe angulata TaxID=980116 RepID=A0A8H5B2M4_9AGAR|nr:hypothetical protein D9611_007056 [Tulosesus angulatus]